MNVPPNKFPVELTKRPRWVVWRLQQTKKVPFNPRNGRMAKCDDPSTWTTYSEAVKALESGRYGGLGFMLGDGIAGIDLDHCRDPRTELIQPWALEVVSQLNSYTEVSPSGEGLHILVRGRLAGAGVNRKDWQGRQHIEIYDTHRYFTVSGTHLSGTPTSIEDRQNELQALYRQVCKSRRQLSKEFPSASKSPSTDEDLMDLAMNAKNGKKFERLWDGDVRNYKSRSEADAAFVQILAFYSTDDRQIARLWQASGLNRDKQNRNDYIRRTIERARFLQRVNYSPQTKLEEEHQAGSSNDLAISNDPERETYLRKLLANSSRMARARMMMVAALGFEKVPWRFLDAIHAHLRNTLSARIITDSMLAAIYQQNGDASSVETVRRDKKRLLKAQQRIGIELIWYWPGRMNPQTGKRFGSRYISYLDRWTLEAIDLAIDKRGYKFSDALLREACACIAGKIVRVPSQTTNGDQPSRDAVSKEVDAEKRLERDVVRLYEAWSEMELTTGEKQEKTHRLLRYLSTLLVSGVLKRDHAIDHHIVAVSDHTPTVN